MFDYNRAAVAAEFQSSMLVRLFSTDIRYIGVATTCNFGTALSGGLVSVLTTLLITFFSIESNPALYLILLRLLVLFIPWPIDFCMVRSENDSQ